MEYVWKLYEEQDKKCALTGMDISFAKTKKGHATGETTASLDRIDPSRGYTEGNVQWVHKWVNIIKWDFTQEEFLDICKMVVEHNEQKVETSR